MTRKAKIGWSTLFALALIGGLALAVTAQPFPEDEGGPDPELMEPSPPEAGPRALVRQLVHLHMNLGRYYLMDGQLEQAKAHFLAVAQPDLEALGLDQIPENPGPRVIGAQRMAYLMAAVATYLMGDEHQAIALAETARDLVVPEPPDRGRRGWGRGEGRGESRGARRGQGRGEHRGRPMEGPGDPVESFLADPGEFVQRFANGPSTLEERILEIEAELRDNVAQ